MMSLKRQSMRSLTEKAGDGAKSLTQRVMDALGARIASGAVRPGDKLPSEREMIAEFGVSRTVVRDAVARLREQGLVDSRQGAGVFVRDGMLPAGGSASNATLSAIVETIEVRAAIEIEAARLAARRGSPAQLADIAQKCEALTRVASPQDAEAADLAFHLSIARATNNSRFVEFFDFLGSRTIPRAQLGSEEERRAFMARYNDLLMEQHRRIADAILARDSDAAGEAMRVHLGTSQERYIALMRSGGRG